MVTKLLSRAEMLSNPKALEAVKAEADGEAKRIGLSVHVGQLMTIASIKFYELAEHLHKLKG